MGRLRRVSEPLTPEKGRAPFADATPLSSPRPSDAARGLIDEEPDEEQSPAVLPSPASSSKRASSSQQLRELTVEDEGPQLPAPNQRLGEAVDTETISRDLLTLQPLEPGYLKWFSPDKKLCLGFNLSTIEELAFRRKGEVTEPPHFREKSAPSSAWRQEVARALRRVKRELEAQRVEGEGSILPVPRSRRGLQRREVAASVQAFDMPYDFSKEYGVQIYKYYGKMVKKKLLVCPLCFKKLEARWLQQRTSHRNPPLPPMPQDAIVPVEVGIPSTLGHLPGLGVLVQEPTRQEAEDPDPMQVLWKFRFDALRALFVTATDLKKHLRRAKDSGGHGLSAAEIQPKDAGARENVTALLQSHDLRSSDSIVQQWLSRNTETCRYQTIYSFYEEEEREVDKSADVRVAYFWRADGYYNACLFLCLHSEVSRRRDSSDTGDHPLPLPPQEEPQRPEETVEDKADCELWAELLGVQEDDGRIDDIIDDKGESSGSESSGVRRVRAHAAWRRQQDEEEDAFAEAYVRSLKKKCKATAADYGLSDDADADVSDEEEEAEEEEQAAPDEVEPIPLPDREASAVSSKAQLGSPSSTSPGQRKGRLKRIREESP